MEKVTKEKYDKLLAAIRPYGKAAVAFSGGADSSLLAFAAAGELGRGNIVCITARSAAFPKRELQEAAAFCEGQGIRHEIVDFDEQSVDGFASNPTNRCYLCKRALFSGFAAFAKRAGFETVLDGSNADDISGYRPGMQAVRELGVRSPLLEAGLAKEDVREILKALGLPVWARPSFACLATRFPYGEEITGEKLGMADKAEQFLLDRGCERVRVRITGREHYTARIETGPEEIARLAAEPLRGDVDKYFRDIGFTYVTLDLTGYRTGSMDEVFRDKEGQNEKHPG